MPNHLLPCFIFRHFEKAILAYIVALFFIIEQKCRKDKRFKFPVSTRATSNGFCPSKANSFYKHDIRYHHQSTYKTLV